MLYSQLYISSTLALCLLRLRNAVEHFREWLEEWQELSTDGHGFQLGVIEGVRRDLWRALGGTSLGGTSSPVMRRTHPTSTCSPGWRRSTSRAASSDVLKGRRGRLPLTGGAADLLCTAADGRRSWKVRAHGSRHAVHRRRRLVTRGRGSVAFDVAAATNCSAHRSPGDERQHAAAATSA